MPNRRRFAVVATPLLALLVVAAAILLPSGAAPAAAQSTEPAVTCFEISVGWRICVASAPVPIAATSPLPRTTLSYGAPSTTGSVTDDGDYAFLTDPDDLTTLVTTYEGLRTGLRDGTTIGLVLHQNDGHGASHEAFYDLLQANDVVEWREADGCWMRYVVREVHADPAGDPPRTLLTLRIYSHPYPDTGCTGALRTSGSRTFTWTPGWFSTGNLPTSPFWHEIFLWVPEGWSGTLPEPATVTPIDTPWPLDPMPDPDLPPGWSGTIYSGYGGVIEGYYGNTDGEHLLVSIYRLRVWPWHVLTIGTDRATAVLIDELRIIDGWPASVAYYNEARDLSFGGSVGVGFYDAANGTVYAFTSSSAGLRTDPEALIELARQFLPDAHASSCQPRAAAGGGSNAGADLGLEDCGLPTTTLSYGAPVTTGSVTDVGDYAFLTDPDDLTTLVTTYEGLRDGSTTGLVIHKNNSAGASQADFYDLVEAGDIVEWRQASDCFVRYTVTEVKDDPAGDPPRKLLAVAWMTYAFTGCSGAISPTATASLQWGPLPALGGTSLTAPVVHGIYQIVPTSWTGETEDPQPREGEYTEVLPGRKTTIAEARLLPRWRDPDLPSGWVFLHATSGFSETPFGYQSWWATDEGYLGIIIRGEQAGGTGFIQYATGRYTIGGNRKLGVAEARTIAGRPAIISYSPAGPTNDIDFLIRLRLHDPATDSEYTILTYDRSLGGSNVDAVIAIAESLFEPPNAP